VDSEVLHDVIFLPSGSAAAKDNANLREVFLREGQQLYGVFARLLNCGGKARCGTCLVQVTVGLENLSRPTPFEKKLRGAEAGMDGKRLACQAMVRGPITVQACSTA
jgi:ferredoxin